jgi:hypothetical protein
MASAYGKRWIVTGGTEGNPVRRHHRLKKLWESVTHQENP